MSGTLATIRRLVALGSFRVSEHGDEEIEEDGISLAEILTGLETCDLVEDYPNAWKGPSVLVLETFRSGDKIHALWGVPRAGDGMAVLITTYRPDPSKWFARLVEEATQMTNTVTKRIRIGNFLAEVKVELIPDDGAWGPYLSADDAMKLDRVRQALKRGDVATAAKDAQVFEVLPLSA